MIELIELTITDGAEVFAMVQEIGKGQNGFQNSLYAEDFTLFQTLLKRHADMNQEDDLMPGLVPQTLYWLYVDDHPVGYGKLRHWLNDNLRNHGGHIGYAIRPQERMQGYGTIMLKKLLEKAQQKNIPETLITCDDTNTASRKIIEANGGQLTKEQDGSCFYWVFLK